MQLPDGNAICKNAFLKRKLATLCHFLDKTYRLAVLTSVGFKMLMYKFGREEEEDCDDCDCEDCEDEE